MSKKPDKKEQSLKKEVEDDIQSSRKFGKGAKRFLRVSLFSFWTIFYSLAILAAGFVIVTYLTYAKSFAGAQIKNKSTQNAYYDKDGEIIFESYGAKPPEKLSLNELPPVLKNATLASEDADFYSHTAIDLRGIVRAAVTNIKYSERSGLLKLTDLLSEKEYSQGGSTITQQLVKNIYLTDERSFDRKIKEIVYSFELEKKWSKDKIFEEYLNNVYYGEQALGIENASQIYFGKSGKDLTLAEASMLAGLTVAPTKYSPISGSFDEAKKRQEYVLSSMYHKGMITLDEAKEAANEPLDIKSGDQVFTNKHPYFASVVTSEVISKIGQEAYDAGGIKVYTTLDSKKQVEAEKIAQDYINNKYTSRGVSNSSVVILDNENEGIAGLVGGVDWEKSKVNVALAERQPGSSFKPIVYTAGLLKGYTAGSPLLDQSVNFGGNPPYRPKNYDGKFHGTVTVRTALANSLNVPAVEMAKLAGVENVMSTAEKMGIGSLGDDPSRYGLSIGLGAGEVKLFELTRAYSVFANQGELANFSSITKIIDDENAEIYKQPKLKREAIDPKVAYIMSDILSDNEARKMIFGTNHPLKLTDRPVAAKTGTTDNFADSWTIGFTPQYTVGVWMGNNDRTVMKKVSGVEGAAYIWHDVMAAIHKEVEVRQFEEPQGIVKTWIDTKTGQLAKREGRPYFKELFVPGTEPKINQIFSYLNQFKSSYSTKR